MFQSARYTTATSTTPLHSDLEAARRVLQKSSPDEIFQRHARNCLTTLSSHCSEVLTSPWHGSCFSLRKAGIPRCSDGR